MDGPTYSWLRANLLPVDFQGKTVLEVGSADVNGSVRPLVQALGPEEYLGVDIAPGKGVDMVLSVHDLDDLGGDWGAVISTEMLEHVEDWRDAVNQLKVAVKPGGALILTTRRPGFPRHCHPHDHWRFTADLLTEAFRDFWVVKVATLPGHGVAIHARKPLNWEAPAPLLHLEPVPAPRRDQGRLERALWLRLSYRGVAYEVEPHGFQAPCCIIE